MKDSKNNIGIVHLLDAQDLAHADTKSKVLDTASCRGAMISVNLGTFTGVDSSNYLVPTLQESDTTADTDFGSVASTDIIGAFTKVDSSSKDQVTQYVGYKGFKRYIRVLLDYTGTGITASLVSVDGILAFPSSSPITVPDPITAT